MGKRKPKKAGTATVKYVGLVNKKNSCWLSSTITIFLTAGPVRHIFDNMIKLDYKPVGTLLVLLLDIYSDFTSPKDSNPLDVLELINYVRQEKKMQEGNHEDCDEVLGYLLDTMSTELDLERSEWNGEYFCGQNFIKQFQVTKMAWIKEGDKEPREIPSDIDVGLNLYVNDEMKECNIEKMLAETVAKSEESLGGNEVRTEQITKLPH